MSLDPKIKHVALCTGGYVICIVLFVVFLWFLLFVECFLLLLWCSQWIDKLSKSWKIIMHEIWIENQLFCYKMILRCIDCDCIVILQWYQTFPKNNKIWIFQKITLFFKTSSALVPYLILSNFYFYWLEWKLIRIRQMLHLEFLYNFWNVSEILSQSGFGMH